MNLVGCFFGCMPVCHGAGGLAAQHRFGARTGTAVILLGAAKLAVAVAFGDSVTTLAERFPDTILGVMLLASALELAGACRRTAWTERGAYEMLLVAACTLWGSTFVGFVAGAAAHAVLLAADAAARRLRAWRSGRGKKLVGGAARTDAGVLVCSTREPEPAAAADRGDDRGDLELV